MENNVNTNIECNVANCKYHNKDKNYCSLNTIRVGNCGPASSSCDCTKCASYEMNK